MRIKIRRHRHQYSRRGFGVGRHCGSSILSAGATKAVISVAASSIEEMAPCGGAVRRNGERQQALSAALTAGGLADAERREACWRPSSAKSSGHVGCLVCEIHVYGDNVMRPRHGGMLVKEARSERAVACRRKKSGGAQAPPTSQTRRKSPRYHDGGTGAPRSRASGDKRQRYKIWRPS